MSLVQTRECFIPRTGKTFFQADYGSLELCTLAQFCITHFGHSSLGDVINSGLDAHTELASEILEIPLEVGRLRRKDKNDKVFDDARQVAKVANFGFPGGLGAARFVDYAKSGYGVVIHKDPDEAVKIARRLKRSWLKRWPEMTLYFDRMAKLTANGPCTLLDPYTGRIRGGTGYTQGCNDGFQALGAAVAKRAFQRVTKACYAEPKSVMFGSRLVAFIHDELIGETTDNERAHDVAIELERLMVEAAKTFLIDVHISAPPLLMSYWAKKAEAVTDENERLVPWQAEVCSVTGCVNEKGKPNMASRKMRGTPLCGSHAKTWQP